MKKAASVFLACLLCVLSASPAFSPLSALFVTAKAGDSALTEQNGYCYTAQACTSEAVRAVFALAARQTTPAVSRRLEKLLFRAAYRVTDLGGENWCIDNNGGYISEVFDAGLQETVNWQYPAAGCMAYALFSSQYVRGVNGIDGLLYANRKKRPDASQLASFVLSYADPGEQLRFHYGASVHSVVFLVADADGFYFLSENGNRLDIRLYYVTWHYFADILVAGNAYTDETYALCVYDTNGGRDFVSAEPYLRYRLQESTGTYAVISCDKAASGALIIPALHAGKPVTTLGSRAFSGCSEIAAVSVKEGITVLGKEVFKDCTALSGVLLPDGLTAMGADCFKGTAYESDPANRAGGNLYISDYLISRDPSSKTEAVTVRAGTVLAADGALAGCAAMTSLVLPESLSRIGNGFCRDCTALLEVQFGTGVRYLGEGTFDGTALSRLSSNWKHGVLYAGRYAVAAKNAKIKGQCTIRYGTLGIAQGVFAATPGLTGIVLPNSLKFINASAFLDCPALRRVNVPKSVTAVSKNALGMRTDESGAVKADTGFSLLGAAGSTAAKYAKKAGLRFTALNTPAAPKLAAAQNSQNGITVRWNAVSHANEYRLYRRTNGGKWEKLKYLTGDLTAYTDTAVKSGVTYTYTVIALNGTGASGYNKAGISVLCLKAPVLSTPSSAKAGITLKYSRTAGASGYLVYRKTAGGSYTRLAVVKGNTSLSYLDKSAKKNVSYTYCVKAYYAKATSFRSNTRSCVDKY